MTDTTPTPDALTALIAKWREIANSYEKQRMRLRDDAFNRPTIADYEARCEVARACADELAALLAAPVEPPPMSYTYLQFEHAKKQAHADGFQTGWHAALDRIRDGADFKELARLVPNPVEPRAQEEPTCSWCGHEHSYHVEGMGCGAVLGPIPYDFICPCKAEPPASPDDVMIQPIDCASAGIAFKAVEKLLSEADEPNDGRVHHPLCAWCKPTLIGVGTCSCERYAPAPKAVFASPAAGAPATPEPVKVWRYRNCYYHAEGRYPSDCAFCAAEAERELVFPESSPTPRHADDLDSPSPATPEPHRHRHDWFDLDNTGRFRCECGAVGFIQAESSPAPRREQAASDARVIAQMRAWLAASAGCYMNHDDCQCKATLTSFDVLAELDRLTAAPPQEPD